MNLLEAVEARHAARDYTDEPLTGDQIDALGNVIATINSDDGLDIQLVHDVDDAFGGCPTHYGRFKNVRNLIALIDRITRTTAQRFWTRKSAMPVSSWR